MSQIESASARPDTRLVDRMLFFTDAVFAIVLTLLALELHPPPGSVHGETALWQEIIDQSRHFFSFVISFALGSAFWLAHMRTSRMIISFDWNMAIVNLVHLLSVGLLPYAAGLFGQHINSTTAFAGYSIVIMAVSFSGAWFWLTATRDKGRFVGGIGWRQRLAGTLRAAPIGLCFLVGLVLTLYGEVSWARFCWVLMLPILLTARLIHGKPQD